MQKIIVTLSILITSLNCFSEQVTTKINIDETSASIILLATPLKHKQLIYKILDSSNHHNLTEQEIIDATIILSQISKNLDTIQPMFSFEVN